MADGGSGLLKALLARFSRKLVHHRRAIDKSRKLERYLEPYRHEAHQWLMAALEQANYADAQQVSGS